MGHEGMATREYFRAWRMMIGDEWDFTERQRRPPPDPVNAMLSFGYTLLTHEAVAALGTAGLDPAVGFLHQARWQAKLSVFECDLPSTREAARLRAKLRELIGPAEDQIRVYPLDDKAVGGPGRAWGACAGGAPGLLDRHVTWYTTPPEDRKRSRLAYSNAAGRRPGCGGRWRKGCPAPPVAGRMAQRAANPQLTGTA